MLAMLHALASARSRQQIWWLHGARNHAEHSFAQESRELLKTLPNGRSYIAYSKPDPKDQLGRDYDVAGRLSVPMLDQLGVPREADFYLCGPAAFLSSFDVELKNLGRCGQQDSRPRSSALVNR